MKPTSLVTSSEEDEIEEIIPAEIVDRATKSTNIYQLAGLEVRFPYDAYKNQKDIMTSIINAFNGKKHAMLESPTGTGKSMSIVCGALAYLESLKKSRPSFAADVQVNPTDSMRKRLLEKENQEEAVKYQRGAEAQGLVSSSQEVATPQFPLIIIASRTHRQLTQLVRELKRSGYRAKYTVLASRKHYCINSSVRDAHDPDDECKKLAKEADATKKCPYIGNVERTCKSDRSGKYTTDMDIEELVRHGHKNNVCPYMLSKESMDHAEIVFAPYNYIVDPSVRESMGLQIDGALVVIDEAHNIEDVCRAAGGIELTSARLGVVQYELHTLVDGQHGDIELPKEHARIFHHVNTLQRWLQEEADASKLSKKGSEEYGKHVLIWEGTRMIEELASLQINSNTVRELNMDLSSISQRSKEPSISSQTAKDILGKKELVNSTKKPHMSTMSILLLQNLYRVLSDLLEFCMDPNKPGQYLSSLADFRLVRIKETLQTIRSTSNSFIFNIWCLNPAVVFRKLTSRAACVVLTSGTLSPMDIISSELGVSFPIKQQSSHIIDENQVRRWSFLDFRGCNRPRTKRQKT